MTRELYLQKLSATAAGSIDLQRDGCEPALWGIRGPCRWICTEDPDGHVELSISLIGAASQHPPSKAQAKRFLQWLGAQPISIKKTETVYHFILKLGAKSLN